MGILGYNLGSLTNWWVVGEGSQEEICLVSYVQFDSTYLTVTAALP